MEYQGVMATRRFENAVAAAELVVIQGGRRPVGRDGRQAKAEYRFREDGQENAENTW